jgi:hypothetical protein
MTWLEFLKENMFDLEFQFVQEVMEKQDMSAQAVIRQALRIYQLVLSSDELRAALQNHHTLPKRKEEEIEV